MNHRGRPGGGKCLWTSLRMRESMSPAPIYTASNVKVHYELQWSFTLFWKTAPGTESWLAELTHNTEVDGVRIL